MNIQKLHYENISGTLIRREGLLSWRCPLCKAEGQSLEVMRTCPECGSKEATLPEAQPTPRVPEGASFIDTSQLEDVVSTEIVHSYPPPSGWLRAIDEALVTAHIGVANAHDTYEQAKAKLDNLLGFHVDVATDPAVNGGWKLVPMVSTHEMKEAGACAGAVYYAIAKDVWSAMLAAAPETKP